MSVINKVCSGNSCVESRLIRDLSLFGLETLQSIPHLKAQKAFEQEATCWLTSLKDVTVISPITLISNVLFQ